MYDALRKPANVKIQRTPALISDKPFIFNPKLADWLRKQPKPNFWFEIQIFLEDAEAFLDLPLYRILRYFVKAAAKCSFRV